MRFWVEVSGCGFRLRFRVEVSSWDFWLRFSVRSWDKDRALIQVYCCNLSVDVVLNVQFITNWMCVKNNIHILVCGASNEWSRRVIISVVARYHSVKLCALAALAFRAQQNGAVTMMMWRSCQMHPSQKECAIGAVHCKKEGMLLQPLSWRCVECWIRHERDVREE